MTKIHFSPKHWVAIALFAIFILYIIFQARFLILGPRISIETPRNESVVATAVISVSGEARNAAWLSLNGRQIFTDGEGSWSERLIVPEGVSIILVAAKDRFGRETEKRIKITRN